MYFDITPELKLTAEGRYQWDKIRQGVYSTSAGVGKWYRYGWSSHLLTPKGDVYGVRTADGRYAKVTIVSYYCAGAQGGCLTIRYAYQGDGTRRVAR